MSMPSSSVSQKTLQDVATAAGRLKLQMSELLALREEVDRAEAVHISERLRPRPKRTERIS
jgi:hypothetical protein